MMKQRAWGRLPSKGLLQGPCQGGQDAGRPARGPEPHWTAAWRTQETPANWSPPDLGSPQEKALMRIRKGSAQNLSLCLLPAVARKPEQLLEVSPTLPPSLIWAVNLQAPQLDLPQEWAAAGWVTSSLHGQTTDPQIKQGLRSWELSAVALIPPWSAVTWTRAGSSPM